MVDFTSGYESSRAASVRHFYTPKRARPYNPPAAQNCLAQAARSIDRRAFTTDDDTVMHQPPRSAQLKSTFQSCLWQWLCLNGGPSLA